MKIIFKMIKLKKKNDNVFPIINNNKKNKIIYENLN